MRTKEDAEARLKENILFCMVEAALDGHDIGEWELAKAPGLKGYEAKCRRCQKTIYASHLAVYSLLPESCSGKGKR